MSAIAARLDELGIMPVAASYISATSSDIEEIQTELGRSLPPDYEYFLLNYGYARFDEVVSVALPGGEQEAPITIFFGGRDSGEPVMVQLEDFAEQIGSGLLPIARDPFGNLYLLEVAGADPGRVWYASFSEGLRAVPVADSFEDFLNRALVEPDENE